MSDAALPNASGVIDDFEDLFETAPCGYLSVSPDGRIVRANAKIAEWTGYQKDELLGRRLHDVLSVPGRIFYETNISPLLRMQGSVDEVAIDFMTSDRTRLPTLVYAAEKRDADEHPLFTRLTIFRAAERRRYERALIDTNEATQRVVDTERENSFLREQFIAVLGHDLRNPLASISSGVRLLADRETLTPRGDQILSLMNGSVIRASELIDNVLDFARGRLGGGITLDRNTRAPLTPALEQVVAELSSISRKNEIRASFALAEPINCDQTKVGQLLSNLLGNAVTHGKPGTLIEVNGVMDGNVMTLSVTNAGAPIPQAARERLFQPFFRGDIRPNQAGLGLGLHIASEIARAHGGELTVTSDEIQTRFTFTMPAAD